MTGRLLRAVFCTLVALVAAAKAATVTIDKEQFFVVNGERVFPFFFMLAPPPDARTPSGADAWRELKQYGTVFHHCNVLPGEWGAAGEARIDRMLARSAETGLLCAVAIRDLDAPQRCQRFYDIVHEMDKRRPVWLIQAPRGTAESLKRYDAACDIAGLDIYPVSYPHGRHSHLPNKSLSVVGDYTRWIRSIHGNARPVVMCLQVCWSGVANPERTLRFPTFPEQRYMSYQAIINGARGLLYFGAGYEACLNERDRALGWNWTYYDRVLKPVLDELRADGPLYPALVAPDARVPVTVEGAADVEFTFRETARGAYLIAAKREGS